MFQNHRFEDFYDILFSKFIQIEIILVVQLGELTKVKIIADCYLHELVVRYKKNFIITVKFLFILLTYSKNQPLWSIIVAYNPNYDYNAGDFIC